MSAHICAPVKLISANMKLELQVYLVLIILVFFGLCCPLQAWEDTYTKWEQVTKQILTFTKNKADDGQVSM